MHGHAPSLEVRLAPTQHPLANLVSAPLSLLGRGAPSVVAALSLVSLAAAGVAGYRLAAGLAGRVAGIALAVLILTRPSLIQATLYSSIDLPFLALVLWAGVLAAAARPRPRGALALLAVAGLARPEGWGLAALYGAALWLGGAGVEEQRETRARPAAVLALVLAAPLLWGALDLLSTGDPFHSLHGTRALAERLGRPRSAGTAFDVLPDDLRAQVGTWVAFAGVLAALVAVWVDRRRQAAPLAVLGLGLAGFIVLGIAGLPLLTRYALVPGAALMVLVAVAAGDLSRLALAGRRDGRGAAVLAAGALAALFVVGGLGLRTDLRQAQHGARGARQQLSMERGLTGLLRLPEVRAARRGCGPLLVPHYRPVPQVAYETGVGLEAVAVPAGALTRGLALDPLPGPYASAYRLTPIDRETFVAAQITGTRLIAANGRWAARTACP